MSQGSIQLYYDIVSPFSYVAYHVLRNSPVFRNVDVKYSPVFLGGIMKACNNRPPLAIKNKDKWIDEDRTRWASRFNVPIAESAPDGFPINTIPIQRALCVLERTNPTKLLPASDALYKAVWGPPRNEADAHKPAGLAKVLTTVLGEAETKRVLEESGSEANKKYLDERTSKAVEDGAFGLPYFVVTDSKGRRETYWGFNYMGMIIDQLGLSTSSDVGQTGWRSML